MTFRALLHGILFDDPADLIAVAATLRAESQLGDYAETTRELLLQIADALDVAEVTPYLQGNDREAAEVRPATSATIARVQLLPRVRSGLPPTDR